MVEQKSQARGINKLKGLPATMAFILVLFYALELSFSGWQLFKGVDGDLLIKWGSNFGPNTLLEREYWRLITYGFLHSSIVHMAVNFYALIEFGPLALAALGRARFIFIYFLSSVIGGLTSILFNPTGNSVGASASIYGIVAAFIVVSWLKREKAVAGQRLRKPELIMLLVFLLYSFLLGFTSDFMDNSAHIGGFLSGALAALILSIKHRSQGLSFRFNLAATLALASIAPVMAEIDTRRMENNPKVDNYLLRSEGKRLVKEKKYLHGIDKLNEALKVLPDDTSTLLARSEALLELDLFQAALKDLNQILQKDKKNRGALARRAIVYHNLNEWEKSVADLDQAIKLDSGEAMLYNNRAWMRLPAYKEGDNLNLAMADVEKAIKLSPNLFTAYDTRATINIMKGDYEKATADLTECLRKDDCRAAANFHLAIIDFVKGNRKEGERKLALSSKLKYQPDLFELNFCRQELGLKGLGADQDTLQETSQGIEQATSQGLDKAANHTTSSTIQRNKAVPNTSITEVKPEGEESAKTER